MLSTPYIEIYKVFLGGFMKFEQMIDQYMDTNEINKKIELDNYIETTDKQKQSRMRKKDFVETISISDFVSLLGTEHDCNGLKHRGLKSFENPYIVGISNDFALKNPELIIKRQIFVVIDDYGNPGTYINPEILKNIETMEQYKCTLNLLGKISVHSLASINKLYEEYTKIVNKMAELQNTYISNIDFFKNLEVKKLLRKIKKFAQTANDKCIKFNEEQNDMNQIIELQHEILEKFSDVVEKKEETIDENIEYDNYNIDCKINRQKTFIFRNKRGIIRKGR